MKVSVITLGCDKNTVDSERYLATLAQYGGEAASNPQEADVIVVNTCGFIDAAKKESIDAIIEAGRYKTEGNCKAVVAIGCMVERHKDELNEAIPEVDIFLGTSDSEKLVDELASRGILKTEQLVQHPGVRIYSGERPHLRYLKVSEGCDHGCAFCAIPLMRGKHRSFSLNEVIREAQLLELQGAREINLVAQDLAHYGRDIRDGNGLPELLEALVRETSIPWIRLLYLYSSGITPKLLEVMAREPRIVQYLDMPMQHAADNVLKAMRRPERNNTIREKVTRMREILPDVAIRTTCIVGFPGETEDDFQRLMEFLEEIKFENVGVFTYSPQEGTRAAQMVDDVPEELKRERLERLTELQRDITAEKYEDRLGKRVQLLVDNNREGRLPWQAEDVDGITFIDQSLEPGTLAEVVVDDIIDWYDFKASVVNVISKPSTVENAIRKQLPITQLSVGSFGR